MERHRITPRLNWKETVEGQGMIFHTLGGMPYWHEGGYYRFSAKQVDEIEAATNELHQLCLKAGQHIIDQNLFSRLALPEWVVPLIKRSWEEEPPSIYGRFDLAYDGKNPPKLLEYNADTPTMLLESSVIQWFWKEDCFPEADQFNSIHERLVAKWRELRRYSFTAENLYFVHAYEAKNAEETMTIVYLMDTAREADIQTIGLAMSEVGFDSATNRLVDLEDRPMSDIFKLYPWEWMAAEDEESEGKYLERTYGSTRWIEPIWKMMFSNKGILPILWELNPKHPNLLEAHFDKPGSMREYVRKPLLSREGANVHIIAGNESDETGGEYGEEGYICQEYVRLPVFDGLRPVLGSWVVDGEAAGMGIRETTRRITDNMSRFTPHIFE